MTSTNRSFRTTGHRLLRYGLYGPEKSVRQVENGSWPDMVNGSLPSEMVFSDGSMLSVVAYSVLFVIAAIGNLMVFIALFRNRHKASRINVFVMHLAVADLIVTFIMLPMEITWHVTVAWFAGDVACRVLMFFRTFGFYLSSFILIAISLDRYFAIAYPMSLNDGRNRSKLMLVLSWAFGFTASIPQSVIFHVEQHPDFPWFSQCVTFNFFPTPAHELAYNLFNVVTIYLVPLLAIIVCYTLILCHISRNASRGRNMSGRQQHRTRALSGDGSQGRPTLRRSGLGKIMQARVRTLRMTIVIVLVFIVCWTPYFVISAWWWIDLVEQWGIHQGDVEAHAWGLVMRKSAKLVDFKIQRGLFIFAVSNSCMNPVVYGMFSAVCRREVRKLYYSMTKCFQCKESPNNSEYISGAHRHHVLWVNRAGQIQWR